MNREPVRREELSVGYQCTMACPFCFYQCSPRRSMRPLLVIRRHIAHMRRAGIEEVELSGGEPLLHPDIDLIVRMCVEAGFSSVSMITNGALVRDRARLEALHAAGVKDFIFSVHGATAEVHDHVTAVGAFETICSAMTHARALGIPFRINMVVTSETHQDIHAVALLARAAGAYRINYLMFSPLNAAAGVSQRMAVRYSACTADLVRAIEAVKHELDVRVRYLPFCLLPGYEHYICGMHQVAYDPNEWDYMVRESLMNGAYSLVRKVAFGVLLVPLQRLMRGTFRRIGADALAKTICHVLAAKIGACRRCAYYHICDGVWRSYRAVFGTDELRPIPGRKVVDPAELLCQSTHDSKRVIA